MTAIGRVTVQTNNVTGHAAKVTYNEEKDQLIFDGGPDGFATLYKVEIPGTEPKKIEGKKITYIRRTGEYKVDSTRSLSGG
jgi:lipopolysaccharide export system protein LptA